MKDNRKSFWRRHRWLLWFAALLVVIVAAVGVTLTVLAHRIEPFLRATIVQQLEDRFHTHVELDSFRVNMTHGQQGEWGVWAVGNGLRIWPPKPAGSTLESAPSGVPPLISLGRFSFQVPIRTTALQSLHIKLVRLDDLKIVIPPHSGKSLVENSARAGKPSPSPEPEPRPALPTPAPATSNAPPQTTAENVLKSMVIDRVECGHAELLLETDKPNKLPLDFDISHLTVTKIVLGEPMNFEAALTNPRPRGTIHTSGTFGPWNTYEPGDTPVSGTYTFEDADLGTFRGIGGALNSTGKYSGTLDALVVDGEADVPDFRLAKFGTALPLRTQFHAHVDGTDGDTWLDRVDATLGRSSFTTEGKVVRVKPIEPDQTGAGPLQGGHEIDMKVQIQNAFIDDFLRLTSHSGTSLLTGGVATNATLHIPPGKESVEDRIVLDGSFELTDVKFTKDTIQKKITELSLRGLGKPDEIKTANPDGTRSQLGGAFHMAGGVISLPDLQFAVPGAAIHLNGTYALSGQLNFAGAARMQATVSRMVGGWKGMLLKPADQFFKKDGAGTQVPIKISGTREAPEFQVEIEGLKKTVPASPASKQP